MSFKNIISYEVLIRSQILIVIFLISALSPLMSLYVIVALIIIDDKLSNNKFINFLFVGVLSYTISAIVASRNFGVTSSDDFIGYYDAYLSLDLISIFILGGGVEFGSWLIIYAIKLFNPNLTPSGLIFFYTFVIYVILFTVASFLLRKTNASARGLAMSFLIFYSEPLLASQIIRQYAAIPFMMLAIFENQVKKTILYLVIGVVFHVSSTIIALPIILLLNENIKMTLKILSFMVISFALLAFYVLAGDYFNFFLMKSQAYLAPSDSGSVILWNLVVTSLIPIFLYAINISFGIVNNQILYVLKKYIIVYTGIALIILGLGNITIAYRILFPFVLVYFWILVFNGAKIRKFEYKLLFIPFILLSLLRISMNNSHLAMGFWNKYEPWGVTPFYYLNSYFN